MNEYTYSLHTPGLYTESVLSFVPSHGLALLTGFSSLYSTDAATAKAVVQAGTTKDFKGVVWSERLWIDVDTKGLTESEAIAKLEAVENRIKEMGYDYVVYDSGGHTSVGGGHFGILREEVPSHLLPSRDRSWVRKHFPEADTSIYSHLHLFRLPGTVHETTGRTKHLVGRQSGQRLTLPPLEKAEMTRTVSPSKNSGVSSVFSNFSLMSLLGPVKVGERHFRLVKIAFELRDHGVAESDAMWFMLQANKMFYDPKDEMEVAKILQDIYVKQ